MPKKKRKKYPKLPAGFGSIRYLGSGRRNCYAVHPPARIDALGNVLRPAAICYTDDWINGINKEVLHFTDKFCKSTSNTLISFCGNFKILSRYCFDVFNRFFQFIIF